ncbi:MAG: Fe-S cluster assembly protein SufD [Chloroflexi bacterium]|nr:Fe-S cluster assembly protein SufD [Chloroflexota bacterium]MDA1145115.1 Fe-S cluster assembly protein SufD [Chloroflexota bacterium]
MADVTTTTSAYTEAAIITAASARNEPDWLLARRTEGARAFESTPMPTPQLRPWKYTDVSDLVIESHAPAEPVLTIEATAPPGAFAGSLREAIAGSEGDQVRERLGSVVTTTEGRFLAANAAHWTDGVYVRLPRGARLESPVVATIDATAVAAGSAVYPRVLIDAGVDSEATVVLRFRSSDAPLLVSSVIEIVADSDSRVRVLIDDRWGSETREFTTARSRVGRSADVQVASLAIGGRIIKQTIEALIEGEGANSTIRGVALGDGDQHFDFVTLQDHIGPKSTSDVEIKAALAGASKSIYYGVTRVEVSAKGSHAEQVNRNLLLSRHSKADSDPVLEILTSDVIRCGHGATVGPVDEEALFYLQSRGLPRRAAFQLLVAGFFQSVIQDIPVAGLAEELESIVVTKLADAEL